MRGVFLAGILGLALAQAPKPLRVGALTGEALYPGGRGLAYGEATLVARGLGLALWRGRDQVALGLGARHATFRVYGEEARAAREGGAWRRGEGVYVPLRPLAQVLGLTYVGQEGIRLELPKARLLEVGQDPRGRLLLRFSREVNAYVRPDGVLLLGAEGEAPGVERDPLGLFLPFSVPPKIRYPGEGRVVLEWEEAPKPRPQVLLDPGHGGEDPGLRAEGFWEKDLTLDLARKVAALLPGARLTRTQDQTLPLKARLEAAKGASVFVSLHVRPGAGIRIYLPERPTTPLAQNAPGLLQRAPEDRARLLKAFAGDPRALGELLTQTLAGRGLPAEILQGPYALGVPGAAVLLEVGAERLKTGEGRLTVAKAVAEAIRRYLEGNAAFP